MSEIPTRRETEMQRVFIEETTVYEIVAETPDEARKVWAKFLEDGYSEELGLKLRHTDTIMTNQDGEELNEEEI
jgi:hypothetical protein